MEERNRDIIEHLLSCTALNDIIYIIGDVMANDTYITSDSLIEDAESAMKERNFLLALKRWAVLRKKFPHCPHGYFRAAHAYLELGKWNDADIFCKYGMNMFPKNPSAYVVHADIAIRQGNTELALERLELVRAKFPEIAHGYFMAARIYMNTGQFDKAEDLCLQAKKVCPKRYEAYILYADIALRQRYFDIGMKRYLELKNIFPNMLCAYINTVQLLISNNKLSEAESIIMDGLRYFPNSQELNIFKINILIKRGNTDKAIKEYEILKENNKNILKYYINQAYLHIQLQQFQEALDLLNEFYENNHFIDGASALTINITRIDILGAKNSDASTVLKFILFLIFNNINCCENPKIQDKLLAYSSKYISLFRNLNNIADHQILLDAIAIMLIDMNFINKGSIFMFIDYCVTLKISYRDVTRLINEAIRKYTIRSDISDIFNINLDLKYKTKIIDKMIYDGIPYVMKFTILFPELKNIIISTISEIVSKLKFRSLSSYVKFNICYFAYIYSHPMFFNLLYDLCNVNSFKLNSMEGLCKYIKHGHENLFFFHSLHNTLKERLNIAICVSGQLRGYRNCINSIIDSFDIYNHDYAFFVSTWSNIGRKFPNFTHAWRVFSGHFLKAYMNVFSSLPLLPTLKLNYSNFLALLNNNDIITKEELQHFYETSNVIIENDSVEPYAQMSNLEKMQYKKYSCVSMTQAYNFDLILHIRPDIRIVNKPSLSLTDIYNHPNAKNSIFINGKYRPVFWGKFGIAVDESIEIGTYHVMNIYSNTYNAFKNTYWPKNAICAPGNFSAHVTNQYHMFCSGIHVEDIPGLKYTFEDPDKIPIETIYKALKRDVATRTPTENDKMLLQACEEDMKR